MAAGSTALHRLSTGPPLTRVECGVLGHVPLLLMVVLQVVEIAPAPNLAQNIKDALYADAVKLAKHVGYRNAGVSALRWYPPQALQQVCAFVAAQLSYLRPSLVLCANRNIPQTVTGSALLWSP